MTRYIGQNGQNRIWPQCTYIQNGLFGLSGLSAFKIMILENWLKTWWDITFDVPKEGIEAQSF